MKPGHIVSTLVASKLRVALLVLIVGSVAIGGGFVVGVLGIPGVASMDNTFGDVTDETTTIETDLVISNPNPIGIGTQDISVDYIISMNSIEMAHGERDGIEIGTENSTLALETQMRNTAIPSWWTSHIESDEQTEIGVDATITSDRLGRSVDFDRTHDIETDLIGSFNSEETRPVNADSPLTDDPVLYINETRGEWGTVSESETPIDMEFVVYNPNLEPYAITELGYEITMNDVEMGDGETHNEYVIPSHSTETIALTTILNNQHLDDWWVTHLDEAVHGHQVSDLRIEFSAVVELPTGAELAVPLDELTYEELIETDIFDEGEDVGEPADSSNGAAESDDEPEESDDGGAGDTPEDGDDGGTGDNDTDDTDEEDADNGDDDTDDDQDDQNDDDGLLL